MKPIIFLDIDGVLNGLQWNKVTGCNGIDSTRVQYLNMVLRRTNARIVISSAWRYMIHCGAMTFSGFEYMLRTHGASQISGKILGVTPRDEDIPERCDQITAWIKSNGHIGSYVVIDDCDYGFKKCGHPFVHTNGKFGLTKGKANEAIKLLNK